jgi:hypothetical protein
MKEFKLTLRRYTTMEVTDDVGFPYLSGYRPTTWYGLTYTKISMGRHLLLQSTYSTFIFRKIRLIFQDLPKPVSLIKHKGRQGMVVGGDTFSVEILYFKKADYRFFKNDQPCGEVYPIGGIVRTPPYEYRIVFEEGSEDNLYLLVCHLTCFLE